MIQNSITHLKEGSKAKIINIVDDQMASKLFSMGVLPGSEIEIIKIAPFNGGIYLKVDGNSLALRVNEAESVIVES